MPLSNLLNPSTDSKLRKFLIGKKSFIRLMSSVKCIVLNHIQHRSKMLQSTDEQLGRSCKGCEFGNIAYMTSYGVSLNRSYGVSFK